MMRALEGLNSNNNYSEWMVGGWGRGLLYILYVGDRSGSFIFLPSCQKHADLVERKAWRLSSHHFIHKTELVPLQEIVLI
jgi:hypothetical protein